MTFRDFYRTVRKWSIYLALTCLILVNLFMTIERDHLVKSFQEKAREGFYDKVEAGATEQEENLLLMERIVLSERYSDFPLKQTATVGQAAPGVEFVLIFSMNDCMNCVLAEIKVLNKYYELGGKVVGYSVDDQSLERAGRFIGMLKPSFPIEYYDPLSELDGIGTPVVLALRPSEQKILDVHKPLPEDLKKRNVFYTRWQRILQFDDLKNPSGLLVD